MKYLICSDIHGSATSCERLLQHFEAFHCDKIILLGDTLYHGPRNPVPLGHNPSKVAELLNQYSDKIIACRGNCDAEVDQWLLNFPTMADFAQFQEEDITIFCTHGHVYAPVLADGNKPEGCPDYAKIPNISAPAICFYGHTHIPVLEKNSSGVLVCNPGSPTLPKNNSEPGFGILENLKITLYNLDGKEIKSEFLNF